MYIYSVYNVFILQHHHSCMHKNVKFTHVCIKMLNLQQSDILVDFPIGCLQCSLCLNQCSLHFSVHKTLGTIS